METLVHEVVHLRIALARLALAAGMPELIPGNTDGEDIGWDQIVWIANTEHKGREWQQLVNKLAIRLTVMKTNNDAFKRVMEEKYGRHDG